MALLACLTILSLSGLMNRIREDYEYKDDCPKDDYRDCHTEIFDVVLATWANSPHVFQVSHGKPRTADPIKENVETTYSVRIGLERHDLAIGEFKRD